jgi:hypothetical protein
MVPTVPAALRLRPLGSILRSALFTVGHAGGIQRAPNHVVAHARKILHTTPADEHNRVLLQIMANPRDICGHFDPVGEPHAGNFPQRRIGLLGSRSIDTGANSPLLRATLQRRARCLPAWRFPPVSHKLVKRRHEFPLVAQAFLPVGTSGTGIPPVEASDI